MKTRARDKGGGKIRGKILVNREKTKSANMSGYKQYEKSAKSKTSSVQE
jgi:hypothetical protein